jgi:hypothetical protein
MLLYGIIKVIYKLRICKGVKETTAFNIYVWISDGKYKVPIKIAQGIGKYSEISANSGLIKSQLYLTQHKLFDELTIEWTNTKLYMAQTQLIMPAIYTIPLKHKYRIRNIMNGVNLHGRFAIKHQNEWTNIPQHWEEEFSQDYT